MNRIPSLSDFGSSAPQKRGASQLDHSVVTSSAAVKFPHAIFAPIHYEPNYAYPLLIWFHGPDNDERQLMRLMPLISMRNYVAVAPRAPWRGTGGGHAWRQSDRSVAEAANRAFQAIESVREQYNIARQRVFLAGYDGGGEVALRVGLRYPREFAGVLSIGGRFPRGNNPLAQLADARHLPLFIAQGRDSQVYHAAHLCEDLRLFHAAGMCVTVRQYSCGDVIHQRMLHDMDVWLMDLVTGRPQGEASSICDELDGSELEDDEFDASDFDPSQFDCEDDDLPPDAD